MSPENVGAGLVPALARAARRTIATNRGVSDLRDYEIIAEALERRESVQATCVARPNNVARGLVPRRAASEGDAVGLVLAALVVIVLLPLCFLAPEAFLRLAVQLVGHHVKTSFIERPIDAILDRGLGLR